LRGGREKPGYLSRYSDGQRGWTARVRFPTKISSIRQRPDWLWGSPSLLSNGYPGLFGQWWSGRDIKPTTHLHLVPTLRMVELYLHFPFCLHREVFNYITEYRDNITWGRREKIPKPTILLWKYSAFWQTYNSNIDRLCDLVVRIPAYRFRGPRFDFRHYQIFWELVGLERGLFSLVRIIEELFQGNRGPGLENRD
jgi:hypothetical protein